jgi:hypothetical protein
MATTVRPTACTYDRYGRPVYYRVVPARGRYNDGPPYGNAYGYYGNRYNSAYNTRYDTDYSQTAQRVNCSRSGNCTVKYYDPRYDRRDTRVRYDSHHRYRDGNRWHDDD